MSAISTSRSEPAVAERQPRAAGAPALLYLIKQVELAAKMRLEAILAPHGVTAVQYTALTVLARNPGMTSARLARNSFVRIQSMSQTIAALEERGLISRDVDPESRRQFKTEITPAGWQLIRTLAGPVDELEREMLDGLTEREVATFAAALRHARVALGGSHPF